MKILAIGDVVGSSSVDYLTKKLSKFIDSEKIDFVIANGENASEIRGLSLSDAERLYRAGVDFITLGNHAFGKRDIYSFLDTNDRRITRPANFSASAPGSGYSVIRVGGYKILIINVLGCMYSTHTVNNPFETVDRILERERDNYDFAIMDVHAEATSEKLALARYFDGRIQIIFGTHTHVQTADEQILPRGSAYITDIGMTGPTNGILGTNADTIIARFKSQVPAAFTVADGPIRASGIVVDANIDAKRINSIKRVDF